MITAPRNVYMRSSMNATTCLIQRNTIVKFAYNFVAAPAWHPIRRKRSLVSRVPENRERQNWFVLGIGGGRTGKIGRQWPSEAARDEPVRHAVTGARPARRWWGTTPRPSRRATVQSAGPGATSIQSSGPPQPRRGPRRRLWPPPTRVPPFARPAARQFIRASHTGRPTASLPYCRYKCVRSRSRVLTRVRFQCVCVCKRSCPWPTERPTDWPTVDDARFVRTALVRIIRARTCSR